MNIRSLSKDAPPKNVSPTPTNKTKRRDVSVDRKKKKKKELNKSRRDQSVRTERVFRM